MSTKYRRKQCGLPGAVRAQQCNHITASCGDTHIFQEFASPHTHIEMLDVYDTITAAFTCFEPQNHRLLIAGWRR